MHEFHSKFAAFAWACSTLCCTVRSSQLCLFQMRERFSQSISPALLLSNMQPKGFVFTRLNSFSSFSALICLQGRKSAFVPQVPLSGQNSISTYNSLNLFTCSKSAGNLQFCPVSLKTLLRTTIRGTQRQFTENICSEDNLRSRIFACLTLLSPKMYQFYQEQLLKILFTTKKPKT